MTDQLQNKLGDMTRIGILKWINEVLDLQLTKIQELGSDAAYPQRIPLNKIKWNAKIEIQFIYNFKILQECFEYLGINKKIEIQKLVKANYQDNLYFIQWMKGFLQTKIQNQYQPTTRRNNGKLYTGFIDKKKFYAGTNNFNKQNHDYLLSFREYRKNHHGNNTSMTNFSKNSGLLDSTRLKNTSKLSSSNKSFDESELQTHQRKRYGNSGKQDGEKRRSVGTIYGLGQEGKKCQSKNQEMSVIKEKDGEFGIGDSVDEIF